MTQRLLEMLLQGGGLPAIVASASSYLETDVAILDQGMQVRAWGGACDVPSVLPAIATALGAELNFPTCGLGNAARLATKRAAGWRSRCSSKGSVGAWVLGRNVGGDDVTELALAQVVLVAALFHLEQRAASRARAETIDALVWDAIQGDDAARTAAIDRASDNQLDLDGPMRLFVCELGTCAVQAATAPVSAVRRHVARTVGRTHSLRASYPSCRPARHVGGRNMRRRGARRCRALGRPPRAAADAGVVGPPRRSWVAAAAARMFEAWPWLTGKRRSRSTWCASLGVAGLLSMTAQEWSACS